MDTTCAPININVPKPTPIERGISFAYMVPLQLLLLLLPLLAVYRAEHMASKFNSVAAGEQSNRYDDLSRHSREGCNSA